MGERPIPPSVQASIDRTLSEQQAIVRSYNLLVRSLKQWSVVYERVSAFVEGFGDGVRATANAYLQEISVLEGSLRNVVDALKQAELSRVDDPKSGAKVNPLDALSRGVMGGDTGHLINSLRMQEPNLKRIMVKLADFRSAVTRSLEDERTKWKSNVQDRLKLNNNKSANTANTPVPALSRSDGGKNSDAVSGRRRQGLKTPQKSPLSSNDLNTRPPWSSS